MKIALLTDTHIGARNDSQVLLEYMKKFYSDIFFPTLDKYNISKVVHLGDVYDRRKYVQFVTLQESQQFFLKKLEDRKIQMDIILGNHDVFYKNTNSVNSPTLLLNEYSNIKIFSTATEVTIDKSLFLYVPWITDENREDTTNLMAKTKARFLFGHLEIKNFEMHRGHVCESGLEKTLFDKYDLACSGHFHKKSQQGHIHYLGAPYEMTWIDYNERKGFHILDTDTGEMEFVENPHKLFQRIIYDDSNMTKETGLKGMADQYKDRYLKLIVRNKKNPYLFDKFVTELNEMKPANLVILEERQLAVESTEDLENIQVEDTPTILKNYVKAMPGKTVPKNKLIALLTQLYQEAQEMEV